MGVGRVSEYFQHIHSRRDTCWVIAHLKAFRKGDADGMDESAIDDFNGT
jgi:hypothetical protein